MTKRKICVVTGTRAEYGLLYWLMKEIDADTALDLQIIATGMHLFEEFGNTYQQIEKDGFSIDKKVDISLLSDSKLAISKSMGIGITECSKAFADLRPDLLVVLGDRFEIFSAVSAASWLCNLLIFSDVSSDFLCICRVLSSSSIERFFSSSSFCCAPSVRSLFVEICSFFSS